MYICCCFCQFIQCKSRYLLRFTRSKKKNQLKHNVLNKTMEIQLKRMQNKRTYVFTDGLYYSHCKAMFGVDVNMSRIFFYFFYFTYSHTHFNKKKKENIQTHAHRMSLLLFVWWKRQCLSFHLVRSTTGINNNHFVEHLYCSGLVSQFRETTSSYNIHSFAHDSMSKIRLEIGLSVCTIQASTVHLENWNYCWRIVRIVSR